MSAVAIANLQKLWEKLTIVKVDRVIAREPEDVLMIVIHGGVGGNTDRYVKSNRTADIPADKRRMARVSWRHYYGFAEGIYFQMSDFHGIDWDVQLTMTKSRYGNHTGGHTKPEVGSYICGEIQNSRRGKRLVNWFYCPRGFKELFDMVKAGHTDMSEHEMMRRLVTRDHPDRFTAIAQLVFFDNVQIFVGNVKARSRQHDEPDPRPPHPATGICTGDSSYNGENITIGHRGLWMSMNQEKFVHNLSYRLGEPKWWEEFKRLCTEENVTHEHDGQRILRDGDWCYACEAEHEPSHQRHLDHHQRV